MSTRPTTTPKSNPAAWWRYANELHAENKRLRDVLLYISRATGEEVCADGYSAAWHARKALARTNEVER